MAERDPDTDATPLRIGVRDFRANMASVLKQAQQGRSFLLTSHDEVLAELHPPSPAVARRRQPGALRGKIRMAPDFDMLPPDLLAAMEGEGG